MMTGDECRCPLCGADPVELRALRAWANDTEKAGHNLFRAGYEAGYDVAIDDAVQKLEELADRGAFDAEDEIRKLRP
jgi:hypothetical protein